jgi:hypothetical protein
MSHNVVPLGKANIASDRREEFMRSVAQSFEKYVERNGQEPDAIVYVMGGILTPTQTGWDIGGASKGGGTTMLSLAAVHLLTEAGGRSVTLNG